MSAPVCLNMSLNWNSCRKQTTGSTMNSAVMISTSALLGRKYKSRQPGTAPVGRQSLLQRTQSRQTHRVACRHVGAHCRSRHYGRRDDCNKRGATTRGHLYCDAEVGQGIDFKRENPRQPPLNAAAESLRRLDDSNHISTVVSTMVSGVGLTNMSTGGCCVSSSASHVSATSFIRRS